MYVSHPIATQGENLPQASNLRFKKTPTSCQFNKALNFQFSWLGHAQESRALPLPSLTEQSILSDLRA